MVAAAAMRIEDSDDDDPLFPGVPPPLPEVVPLTTLPVMKLVAPPVAPVPPPVVMMVPPVQDKEDDGPSVTIAESDDGDEYVDIDATAIECDKPMQKTRPSDMQVTSSRANK
jgi:hypothetical protein